MTTRTIDKQMKSVFPDADVKAAWLCYDMAGVLICEIPEKELTFGRIPEGCAEMVLFTLVTNETMDRWKRYIST